MGWIRIRLYTIVIAVMAILTAVLTYAYFNTNNAQLAGLLGGTATGLLVAVIQLLLDWNQYQDIQRIKALGVREVLAHRDNTDYYRELLKKSRTRIWVLGNTANRLLEDFAHPSRQDLQELRLALTRGCEVRILLPEFGHLSTADQAKSEASAVRMAELKLQFGCRFNYGYFDHPPVHSLFIVDRESLVGPIFQDVQSKDCPAIHTHTDSPFVKHYMALFEKEWRNARKP